MSSKLKPYKITSQQLDSLPIVEGQLIVTTDTNKIYCDISNEERITLSDYQSDTNLSGIYYWDGKSSDDNPFNIVLWQDIINKAKGKTVLVYASNENFSANNTYSGVFIISPNLVKNISNTLSIAGMVTMGMAGISSRGRNINIRYTTASVDFTNSIVSSVSAINWSDYESGTFLPTDSNNTQMDNINFQPTHDYHPSTKKYTDEVLTRNNIYVWDGRSSDDNPDNIALWQEIVNKSKENIVIILSGRLGMTNSYYTKALFTLVPNFISSTDTNKILYGYVQSISSNTSTNRGNWIYQSIPSVTLSLSDFTVTKVNAVNASTLSLTGYYLPTNQTAVTNYTPTYDYHPATKKYVDDSVDTLYNSQIGDLYYTVENNKDYFFKYNAATKLYESNNQKQKSTTAQSVFIFNKDVSEGDITINYTVNSEANYDKFSILVGNSIVVNAISGKEQTGSITPTIPKGTKLIVKYVKDTSTDANGDTCTFTIEGANRFDVLSASNDATKEFIDNRITTAIESKHGPYKIMTAIIDESDSNPATCISYADSATGMIASSSEWDDFFGIRPCLMQNGKVIKYLNPNDFTKDINGNTVSLTTEEIDVMIEFPRRGLKITKDGDKVIIKMTDNPNDKDFDYYAHTRGNIQKSVFYLGAYFGWSNNNKLYSLSGKTPSTSKTLETFITETHNRGENYEVEGYFQHTYIQAMYVLKYKNLNSQSVIGQGCTDITPTSGTCNTRGMTYGTQSTTSSIKLFGLEDYYGKISSCIVGRCLDSGTKKVYLTTDNFSSSMSASDYEININSNAFTTYSIYISKVVGSSLEGFIASASDGSSTTYYCDTANNGTYFLANCMSWAGGETGIFTYSGFSAESTDQRRGARLMYL